MIKKRLEKLNKNDFSKIKSKTKQIETYSDFFKNIRKEIYGKDGRILFYLEGDLAFSLIEINNTINPIVYKIENNRFKNLISELFGIEDSNLNLEKIKEFKSDSKTPLGNKDILDSFFIYESILERKEQPFRSFKIKSKNGKVRDITAPHKEMKGILRRICKDLQNIYDPINQDLQVAYKSGKSIYDNAKVHKNHKYIYSLDLKDFFPSCKEALVRPYLKPLFKNFSLFDNSDLLLEKFMEINLINNALFIGSPISGVLANAIISKPVGYISNILKGYKMSVSVYADDITVSSDKFIVKDFITQIFNYAFTKYELDPYFKLNEKKLKGASGCRRKITGIILNDSEKISVPRIYYRKLRAAIHNLSRNGASGINLPKLKGKIAYAISVDDSLKLIRLLEKYKETIEKYNLFSFETVEKFKGKYQNV